MMEKKVFRPTIELKETDEEQGSFRAVFSTFNVPDLDGDVTLPGAFEEGQKVRIAYWGHRWHDLPVGRGVIGSDGEKAWVDGKFFLDTQAGLETYKTVKNLAELQEWSYGFDIEESENAVFEGQDVRILKKMKVHEVSPVLLGAGIGTMTTAIKGVDAPASHDAGAAVDASKASYLENDTASEDADQDGAHLESEAGDPGNESEGVRPEDLLLNINLNLELED